MTYQEVLENARAVLSKNCKACPVCNGKACGNHIPGPGAKGVGDTAIRNYEKWQDIRVNMDTIHPCVTPDTSLNLFGKTFRYPFFAGPVGAVTVHYSDKYDDMAYNNILVKACADNGIAAFTGDGLNGEVMKVACKAIAASGGTADGTNPAVIEAAAEALKKNHGCGVPTVKPWNLETIQEKLGYCRESGCFAVAMDIDAAGLPFLKNMNPPAGSKTVEQLAEIAGMVGKPFIVKGIMTVAGALKAKEAGASAIVVSNHGGRVLDQCAATAEVLADIVDAMKGSGVKIFVDGSIRSGVDVFKALALGADAVLICRPFVPMVYGGAEEGVKLYIEKIGAELSDTMAMCGAENLASINRDMVLVK